MEAIGIILIVVFIFIALFQAFSPMWKKTRVLTNLSTSQLLLPFYDYTQLTLADYIERIELFYGLHPSDEEADEVCKMFAAKGVLTENGGNSNKTEGSVKVVSYSYKRQKEG